MKNSYSINKKSFLIWATAIGLALTQLACGGGGGGSSTVTIASPLTLSTLQGRWVTANGDQVMRWVPPVPGQTAATMWGLSQDGTSLTHLSASVSGESGVTAKGKRYNLNLSEGQSTEPLAVDWTGVANRSASPQTLSFSGGPAFNLQDPLKDGALQLNAVGNWQSNLGLTTLDFSVDALGVISGKSQTGCLYVGVLNARSDVSVYELKLSEACPQGAVQQFTGIGVLSSSTNANINQLTLVMVNADSAIGKALYFQRR